VVEGAMNWDVNDAIIFVCVFLVAYHQGMWFFSLLGL
jgi:hypothetical protein